MLLKRTIVPADLAGKPVGYLNLTRFGNTMGAKLCLSRPFTGALGVGVGEEKRFFVLSGMKVEADWEIPFDNRSALSVALLGQDGKVTASAGAGNARQWEKAYAEWLKDRKAGAATPAPTENAGQEEGDPGQPGVEAPQSADAPQVPAEAEEAAQPADAPQVPAGAEEAAQPDEARQVPADVESVTQPTDVPQVPAEAEALPRDEGVASQEVPPPESGADAPAGQRADPSPFRLPLGSDFYPSVRSRLEETLTVNPAERDLERLIPESRWVKVFYEGDDYYVVGEVRKQGEPQLVGYGVPGVESVEPPEEVRAVTDFLPVDPPDGYWLLFQSARDGAILPNDDPT